ncbi:MAG: hypothetical protein VW268_08120 [Rhodospirillaceae bacterium]
MFDEHGKLRTVFELYEPVDYQDRILARAAVPILSIPGILFLLLALTLNRLVSRAQVDICCRIKAINDLRKRLESFVSSIAVSAARESGAGSDIP